MPLVSLHFHYIPASTGRLGKHYVGVEVGCNPHVFLKWVLFTLTSSQFHLFPLPNPPNGAMEKADGAS